MARTAAGSVLVEAAGVEPQRGTRWDQVLFVLVAYRLLAPGSEWRLHREWFRRSALADLLGEDAGVAEIHKLYRCHDRLLQHKQAVFDHLVGRWRDLFNISYDVLLYDLTSTYFEADPPFPEGDKRRFGYSRDHRPDCVQIVIALVVTPEGLPLAYEVLPGNTSDKTTLRGFLERIERQYGKARRIWLMDRGVPTEEVLTEMRAADPPMHYLVGTPKGRLTRLEKHLVALPWQEARPGVQVKLLAQESELYVLAQSRDRVAKERAMRQRQLKRLWARLKQLSTMQLTREELLMKLGAARDQSRIAWRLAVIEVAADCATFSYRLDRHKLRQVRSREGRYLLRTNLVEEDPAKLWSHYLLLVAVEEAFKNLKGDLAIRPVFHQLEARVEAHVFIAFLAYCLHVTLARRLHALAPGLTPRSVLEKFAAVQMIDLHLPTTDGRELLLTRYTEPEPKQQPSPTKRRQYSEALKRQMVAETQTPGASVSIVARRHDVNSNQLFRWRRQLLPKAVVESGAMVPVEIAPDEGRPRRRDRESVIEITFGCGARVRLRGEVSSETLRQVIELRR